MSDQPRADAVRYEDPRAERFVRRFLRRPGQPPQVVLMDGSVAPQSPVRAYAPMLGAGQRTIYIDCSNEAESATYSAAEVNARMQWQPAETVEVDGRWFTFERGYWRQEAATPADGSADSTAILPAIGAGSRRNASAAVRPVSPQREG